MSELPTGTVTFMFTDIEGSTKLLDQLGGPRYRKSQDDHAAILRRAIAAGGGVEVRTEGDSFFAVFGNALGALDAAVSAQRGLANHQWADSPLRVRMGLHTGEGTPGGDDYVGMDVNRAARIAAAGHGGQVVVSEATRSLVQHALPDAVRLRDLGEHRLKDIGHPEHLYDLVVATLPSNFPPLASLGRRPNNLPLQLTTFVGREKEIADICYLLQTTRLLTVTGPGGAGKTRLALQAAAEMLTDFDDGAFFVDLSSVTDPELVPSAINIALGSVETGGRPLLDVVEDRLREKQLLLIVDNFEQVIPAAPIVERLLSNAPRLKVVATSRMALSLRGEQEYSIPTLQVPVPERSLDLMELCRLEAVRLFAERARAVRSAFEVTEANAAAVAGITARLDGLPLAIELAAKRIKLLTPEQMISHLDHGLALLSSKAPTLPERQRTLAGAIAWSYNLLSENERRLFARLSIFDGGWALDAAETVCDPPELGLDSIEGLGALVDHSLVARTDAPDGEPRFAMLVTIQEFAHEQLDAQGDFEVMRERHARYYLSFAAEAEPHLTKIDHRTWLDRCERELHNLRAALRWAIEGEEADEAQLAASALWRFWQLRGHLAEGRRWLDEILAVPSGQGRTARRTKALIGAGGIAWWQSDMAAARVFYDEALAIARERGEPAAIAEALYNIAHVEVVDGDIESAGRMLEESLDLFGKAGDEDGIARVRSWSAGQSGLRGDWTSVIEEVKDVVAIWRRLGDVFELGDNLNTLAIAYARTGRHTEARAVALEALQISVDGDMKMGTALGILILGFLASWEGRDELALRLAGASEKLRKELGGGPPTDFLRVLVGDPVGEARSRLPTETAERVWEEGRALSMEEAVALAREASPSVGSAV
ncbi:MAG TPA: adenylate/guanylate cyclase domain-containing protein [Acidimicrobiia bacterium]|nr:adenylate/guanylate cyclase domain-containing protein [Acidimicrobiia bacterium]